MNTKIPLIIIGVLGVLVAGFYLVRQQDDFTLPAGGETKTEIVMIEQPRTSSSNEAEGQAAPLTEEKEIFVTDGVKHSVPVEEIQSGGPPKDGIPPIDNPVFISTQEASEWLADEEPGIAFSSGNVHRFYPYQILVWHEIVNDTVEGKRVLVTYCPLCLTGYVLDPLVQGERVEFGTSGKLWKSNLVMYDRKTDSLWSQVLGEAIVGEMTGTRLSILPSDQMRYGDWKRQFFQGEVLSRNTGTFRTYGDNPYGSYFSVTGLALSLADPKDTRLPHDAFVFGITVEGKAKAYAIESVKQQGFVQDSFAGKQIVLRHDVQSDTVRMFEKLANGTEERINPVSGFWFSWAAVYPETELYK